MLMNLKKKKHQNPPQNQPDKGFCIHFFIFKHLKIEPKRYVCWSMRKEARVLMNMMSQAEMWRWL